MDLLNGASWAPHDSATAAALSQLRALLECDQCGGALDGGVAYLLSQCGHSLCQTCAHRFGGGPCPSRQCDQPNRERDLVRDRLMEQRWAALARMQPALAQMLWSPGGEPAAPTAPLQPSPPPETVGAVPTRATRAARPLGRPGPPVEDAGAAPVPPPPVSRAPPATTLVSAPPVAKKRRSAPEKVRTDDPPPLPAPSTARRRPPARAKGGKPAEHLAKRNAKGETALHVASIKGNIERVKALLAEGASPNTQDHAGWTPLHEAAQKEFVEILELLLVHGAAPNVPGTDNITPLHDAVETGNHRSVELLIKHGANKEFHNARGQTPRDMTIDAEVLKVFDHAQCDMSESEQLETSLILPQSSTVIIAPVNLDSDQMQRLKTAQTTLSFKLETKIHDSVTHVLFSNVSESKLVPDGNPSYYESLLMGKKLLEFQWLEACVKAGEFLTDDQQFVIRGTKTYPFEAPTKAYANALRKMPRLLDNCHIYFKGDFKPTDVYPDKAGLSRIVVAGGATLLTREPDPEFIPAQEQKVAFHADRHGSLAKCAHYVIYQEGSNVPQMRYNMAHIKTLPVAWLYESINTFTLVDSSFV